MATITFSSFYGKIRYTIYMNQYNLLRELVALYYGIPEYNNIRKEISLRKCDYPKELLKIVDIDDEKYRVKKIIYIKDNKYPSIRKFLLCNEHKFLWSSNEVNNLYNLLSNIDIHGINQNNIYNDFLNFLNISIKKKSLICQEIDKLDFNYIKSIKKIEQNINKKSNNFNLYDIYDENTYTQDELNKADNFLNLK